MPSVTIFSCRIFYIKTLLLATMFIFSNWLIKIENTPGIMCDEDSLILQNILQSVPRRGLKIIPERAEYIFPALKDSLVSVCVFAHLKKSWKSVFPKKIFLITFCH